MVNVPGALLGISVLVLVGLLQAPAPVPALPGARVVATSQVQANPRFGMHSVLFAPDDPPPRTFGVTRLWDSGAIWCRMNPQPGVWDFTALITQLDTAAARGSTSAIVVLGFPPAHAVEGSVVPYPQEADWLCPGEAAGAASTLPSTDVWDDYVSRTADAVSAWRKNHPEVTAHFQVWNEPGVGWFLRPDQPASQLVDLAARARRLVHLRMPDALLLSPPVVSTVKPSRAVWQQEFVALSQAWALANGQRLFDVWAVHVYPVGEGFDQVWAGPQGYQAKITDVLTTITPGRQPGDQVWITEINANIAMTGPPTHVLTDEDQARFVQAVAQDTTDRGIPVVVWYRWHYDPMAPGNGQIVFAAGSAAMMALRGL